MKRTVTISWSAILLFLLTFVSASTAQSARWSEQKANDWYAHQPWLVGSNYIPKSAINELEMWQAETFDPATVSAAELAQEKEGFLAELVEEE